MRQVILLNGSAREEHGKALNAPIPPGSLLAASGTGDGWVLHGATGSITPIAIARANHERDGRGLSDNILQNESFTVLFPEVGAKVQLQAAGTIARGDEVTCAASGKVDVRAAGDALLGVAASADEDGWVEVWIGGAVPLESA